MLSLKSLRYELSGKLAEAGREKLVAMRSEQNIKTSNQPRDRHLVSLVARVHNGSSGESWKDAVFGSENSFNISIFF